MENLTIEQINDLIDIKLEPIINDIEKDIRYINKTLSRI